MTWTLVVSAYSSRTESQAWCRLELGHHHHGGVGRRLTGSSNKSGQETPSTVGQEEGWSRDGACQGGRKGRRKEEQWDWEPEVRGIWGGWGVMEGCRIQAGEASSKFL